MNNKDNLYFASKDAEDLSAILEAKVDEQTNSLHSNGFHDKLRACYAAYHGAYYNSASDAHQIQFSGEQGELVQFPINHFRNFATHMLNMTTSNRPSLDCRAANTDYKSLVQTFLANNVLDYYLREKRVEIYLKKAVEYAIVYGAGYVIMEWDATSGEIVDYIEDTDTKIYEGDLIFENLSPFDVIYDNTKEAQNHDWVLIRRWKNKYDLAAKYTDRAEEIKELQTKSDLQKTRLGMTGILDKTDDVQVFEFYHKKTPSVPNGRYVMFLSNQIVLQDLPMPYKTLPVFRIAGSDVHGTPHGYTPMFDLLPLQEMLNSLYSTVATNQNAFGVQSVLMPRGSDISAKQIGPLNIIDYNAQFGKPEALQLTSTPAELFKFIETIKSDMETISGINSVARGEPQASLKSGAALALVQSMALQFMSGLQQSYVQLMENVGTSIIDILKDFANTPRMIAIVGKTNRTEIQEFKGDDISDIRRVVVDVGNPLSKTLAGRTQMADNLIQYGEITPEQYVTLIHTGNLNSLTEATVQEEFLIRAENEALVRGEVPAAIFTENHAQHVESHRSVLFDPELKKDAALVERVQQHIQQHINLLQTTNPNTLILLKQQPMPPAGMQAAPPQEEGSGGAELAPPPQGAPETGAAVTGPEGESARMPNMPQVPAEVLPNPAIQDQAMNNVSV